MVNRLKTTAHLYLNGEFVGVVQVQGREDSWFHGGFEPADGFGPFATLFGQWSLLMHAEEGQMQSNAASEELRRLEYEIDKLEAKLLFVDKQEWHDAAQVNIDGGLIEWKEY